MGTFGLATDGVTGAAGLGISGFSEVKAKRVISVIYDPTHEFYEGFQSVGKIFFEDLTKDYNNKPGKPKIIPSNSAIPITPNSQFFPLVGEVVLITRTIGNTPAVFSNQDFIPQTYYYPPVRIHNQTSQNSFPSKAFYKGVDRKKNREKVQDGSPNKSTPIQPEFSLGEYFEDRDTRRLIPFEGDYIIEGRFGNSIRFGSTTPHEKEKQDQPFPNPWSIDSINGEDTSDKTKAKVGDPITIIRNGQKVDLDPKNSTLDDYLEDINSDDSSIYMCSNQRLSNLRVAGAASPVTQDSYLPTGSQELSDDDIAYLKQFEVVGATGDVGESTFVNTAVGPTGVNPNIEPIPDFVPPVIPIPELIERNDETDDGLSFYNEMVERSGVVAADHFITETVYYTSSLDLVTGDPQYEIINNEVVPVTTPEVSSSSSPSTNGVILMTGVPRDKTHEQQVAIFKEGYKGTVYAYTYNGAGLSRLQTAIGNNPTFKVVLFSAACRHSDKIAETILSTMATAAASGISNTATGAAALSEYNTLNGLYMVEPFCKNLNTTAYFAVRAAVKAGVPPGNVQVGTSQNVGKGVLDQKGSDPSLGTPSKSPSGGHFNALKYLGSIL